MFERVQLLRSWWVIEITMLALLSVSILILDSIVCFMIIESAFISELLSAGLYAAALTVDVVTTIFACISLLMNCICVWIDPQNKIYISKLSRHFFVIFIVIREAIFFKLFTCFNYADNSLLIARSSLNFVLFAIAFISLLINIFNGPPKVSLCIISAYVAPFITILALNIVLLVLLKKPLEFPINASNINIGYFNQTEIDAIKSNTYVKDDFSDMHFICTLDDLINSEKKTLSSTYTRDNIYTGGSNTYYIYLHTVSWSQFGKYFFIIKKIIQVFNLI